MDYAEHAPAPPLAPFVKCIWTLRARAAPLAPGEAAPPPDRILPDGCAEVVINLADRFVAHEEGRAPRTQPAALLVAQVAAPIRIAPSGDVDLVGIRFRPGGLHPLLGLDLEEVAGASLIDH